MGGRGAGTQKAARGGQDDRMENNVNQKGDIRMIMSIIGTNLMIELPRELDHHNAERIRREADNIIATKNIRNIVFDFEKTEFMDSSGIGVIMGRYKNISMTGGSVMAIHMNQRMDRIFLLSGLHKIVQVISDERK